MDGDRQDTGYRLEFAKHPGIVLWVERLETCIRSKVDAWNAALAEALRRDNDLQRQLNALRARVEELEREGT